MAHSVVISQRGGVILLEGVSAGAYDGVCAVGEREMPGDVLHNERKETTTISRTQSHTEHRIRATVAATVVEAEGHKDAGDTVTWARRARLTAAGKLSPQDADRFCLCTSSLLLLRVRWSRLLVVCRSPVASQNNRQWLSRVPYSRRLHPLGLKRASSSRRAGRGKRQRRQRLSLADTRCLCDSHKCALVPFAHSL